MEDDRRHIVPIVPIVVIDRVLQINKGLVLLLLLFFIFYVSPEGTGWLAST